MNSEKIIDAFGGIDDELIEEVEMLRKTRIKNKSRWISRGLLVACFAILIAVGCTTLPDFLIMNPNNIEPSTGQPATQGVNGMELNVERLIYLNNSLYSPNPELTQVVSQKNVGDFLGYISLDGINQSTISAYALEGSIGEGNNIVINYNGAYYAYTFCSFVPDGSEEWPANLLKDATHIEVRDSNYGIDNTIVYLTIFEEQDVSDMLDFLSALGEKHDQVELNRRYYERFKYYFSHEDLWLDQEGNIVTSNIKIETSFSELVCGTDRKIVVVMEDSTELTYSYLPGAGVILCDNFGFFLSDKQVSQINQMIGLQ